MAATCSVFLNVMDIEKSVAFYQGLGFKVDAIHRGREGDGPVRYADLSYQGAELGLGHIAVNPDPEFRAWVGTPLGAGVVVTFSVPDVDRVFEKAKALGAVIEHAPEDRSYGRVFGLNDPDGYVVSFIKEPRRATGAASVKKAAAKAKKAVAKTAKRATGGAKPAAARSLDAARRQSVKTGVAKKSLRAMRKSDRGMQRADGAPRRGRK